MQWLPRVLDHASLPLAHLIARFVPSYFAQPPLAGFLLGLSGIGIALPLRWMKLGLLHATMSGGRPAERKGGLTERRRFAA